MEDNYRMQSLNEDEEISAKDAKTYDVNTLMSIYTHRSQRFVLSDGTIMGAFGVDINNPIALEYHYKKTPNFDTFIDSINNFLSIQNKKLSGTDINKLRGLYGKKFTINTAGVDSATIKEIKNEVLS